MTPSDQSNSDERIDAVLELVEDLRDRLNAIEAAIDRNRIDNDDIYGRIDALSREIDNVRSRA